MIYVESDSFFKAYKFYKKLQKVTESHETFLGWFSGAFRGSGCTFREGEGHGKGGNLASVITSRAATVCLVEISHAVDKLIGNAVS